MFLLHVNLRIITEFSSGSAPPYAILSHRWENDELTFHDIFDDSAAVRNGYAKIDKACEQAAQDGLDYLWVDTCCINKTSSAELSEAINSMFNWYKSAAICYVYLSDVEARSDLAGSLWFTRGWTLQELVAPPPNMKFFNRHWDFLGTKGDLKNDLSHTTGILPEILSGADFKKLSIAQRMSWASNRETTRIEDMAYCLLGIFDINMPLLYGEGNRAFTRLQEEIIKQSDDQTIFAWDCMDDKMTGLLAPSPDRFRNCFNCLRAVAPVYRFPYSMTNKGLSIKLRLICWTLEVYVALLDCQIYYMSYDVFGEVWILGTVGIFLRPLQEEGQFARITLSGKDKVFFPERAPGSVAKLQTSDLGRIARSRSVSLNRSLHLWNAVPYMWRAESFQRDLYFRKDPYDPLPWRDRVYGFWLRKLLPYRNNINFNPSEHMALVSLDKFSHQDRLVRIPEGCRGAACLLLISPEKGSSPKWSLKGQSNKALKPLLMKFGFTRDFEPACFLKEGPDPEEISWVARDSSSGSVSPSQATELAKVEWTGSSEHSFVGARNVESRFRCGAYQIYIKKKAVDETETYVVDVIFAGPGFICDNCHQSKKDERFVCLSCPIFTCCLDCYRKIDISHRKFESGPLKHQFRRVVPDTKSARVMRPFPIDDRLELPENELTVPS